MSKARGGASLLALVLMVTTSIHARPAGAGSSADIDRDVNATLAKLDAGVPEARPLAKQAKAILVFPSIVKAGFLFGAQYGEGALRREGKSIGYYNTVAVSYGLQAGVQTFGYVLFFMTDSALRYLEETGGFEIGLGPSIVVLDVGAAKALTTTTIQSEIYAFIFDQTGLMAGLGLQGSKISRIDR
jgi:lipid-binding SYLF domain-containing protein